MRQIYYTIQTLLRGRASNVTKIISLTLGLFVGILLFARVAFELNYDSFYREPDKLFIVQATYTSGDGQKEDHVPYVYAKLPAALKENFPAEIEDATVIRDMGGIILFNGNNRLADVEAIYADQQLFSTTGIEVLKGNAAELATPDAVFLSQSLARRAFGDADPIGQTLMGDKTYPFTVRGVFADLPENTDMKYDLVVAFSTIRKTGGSSRGRWGGDISYRGLIRFRDVASASEKVTAGIPRMMQKYMPAERSDGAKEEYSFLPIRESHSSQPNVQNMIVIMSVLAIAILLIAALNYVLISVSSLAQRAKAIGVHKCSGASDGNIFALFLWETTCIVMASLLLVGLLMLNFRGLIEDTLGVSIGALFSWETLWVPLLVVVVLFLVAGVLPGRMFSSIPVTQVFRRYTERRTSWKRPLLFVQFAGIPFVFGLLVVVLLQYQSVMNRELNYNPDRVVITECGFNEDEVDKVRSDLRRLPMVEDVAFSWFPINNGYSGYSVYNEGGKMLFDARTTICDYHFLPMMGVGMKEGKGFDQLDQAIVNEEFVRRMRWTDSPVGKNVNIGKLIPIVGVMKDFPIRSAYSPQDIVLMISNPQVSGSIHIRLKEPFDENLKALNEEMKEMYPSLDIVFAPLQQKLDEQYDPIRHFRDSVVMASVSILLITLMGLFGYTNDEVRRRSKEIAIRKVNGAEAASILHLLSLDIVWTALPATMLGGVAAWFVSGKWLEQFSDVIRPGMWVFALVAVVALLLIVAGVVLRAWNVANENPVKSIVSE